MTIDVKGGNRRALRLMIGQSTTQSFTTGDETVFLYWAHRIPTVIDASQPEGRRPDRGPGPRRRWLEPRARSRRPRRRRVADREPKAQEAKQNAQA